jgi:hypothetical protein
MTYFVELVTSITRVQHSNRVSLCLDTSYTRNRRRATTCIMQRFSNSGSHYRMGFQLIKMHCFWERNKNSRGGWEGRHTYTNNPQCLHNKLSYQVDTLLCKNVDLSRSFVAMESVWNIAHFSKILQDIEYIGWFIIIISLSVSPMYGLSTSRTGYNPPRGWLENNNGKNNLPTSKSWLRSTRYVIRW